MSSILETELMPYPLCLGGNVFGWTIDEGTSFEVLDAYAEAGGNFIDTADVYSAWVPGNEGGESESIIGAWMRTRGNRDTMIIGTKVGQHPGLSGLRPGTIRQAADASLRRLQTDRIDVYWLHQDDPTVPLADSLGAIQELIDAGKIRCFGVSNYAPSRIVELVESAKAMGFRAPVAIQPSYNLVDRSHFEQGLQGIAERHGLGCVPYYGLAKGFLTGKYRGAAPTTEREDGAAAYLDGRGRKILDALDDVASRRGVTMAAVALAWLARRPTVVAPIASARTVGQIADLLQMASLDLDESELVVLGRASEHNES